MLLGWHMDPCAWTCWSSYVPPKSLCQPPFLPPPHACLWVHKLRSPAHLGNSALVRGFNRAVMQLARVGPEVPERLQSSSPRGPRVKEQARFQGTQNPGKKRVLMRPIRKWSVHRFFSFKRVSVVSLALSPSQRKQRNGTQRKTFRFVQLENIPNRI